MKSRSLTLQLPSTRALEGVLSSGGFDVVSMGDPWNTDSVSWQAFLCCRKGSIINVSIAVRADQEEAPLITVSRVRRILWFLPRLRDRDLLADVASYLIQLGATPYAGNGNS